ncbi:insulin receptor substrate 1 isoform X2 [Heterodontus francisci]|uniref:insulin receptor substrate 1 isoform X2 n=1 Tax=Heterodontus francisci TaxID=7792 RepID=UPI00355BAB6C
MMASPPEPSSPSAESFSDVRKVGYLRKPKSMHRRFFVLRAPSELGPARLEYYENEKKWRHKAGAPKRSVHLESCFNINKRADSKNKYLVALYTRDEYFAVAADCESEQESWYQALLELHNRGKVPEERGERDGGAAAGSASTAGGVGAGEDSYGEASPGPAFKEVWQVVLKPKGLGHTKNLVGIYRLCLTNKTISLVKLNSDAAAVVLQLMNIRRCGHSENFFFIEVGRSAVTGPGEFWMQVDDSVVAQNMHETILEAMKAMSEEFRPRSKSQSASSSNPISVPLRRHLNNPPPSQVGLSRRSRTESITTISPAGKHNSFRVRASSDGEGTMSRPASVDGSPVSPSATRGHTHRHRGGCRLHPPLNHSRSIPMPSTHCSPSATSPVSLSSSSTSGHGSTSDSLFPRRSSASISGSPSDGGFISSDEYGSSPCDFRNSFRSVTPDSLGHTPPAREEQELNNYIYMVGDNHPDQQRPPMSEYMNMNLKTDASKFGYVSKSAVDITSSASACTSSTCRKDRGQASCDYVSMQLVATCPDLLESSVSNYTEMTVSGGITPSISILPRAEESSLNTVSDVLPGPMLDQISGRSAFTVLNLVPNRSQGAKVIRVDPQGRRRHSSETFTSTASVTGITLSYVDHIKRHSSVSFENVWLNKSGDSLAAGAKDQPNDATVQNDCGNSMNYIDLDLLNDFNNKDWTSSQHVTPHQPHGSNSGGGDELNSYASITFQKPDEISKPTEREE